MLDKLMGLKPEMQDKVDDEVLMEIISLADELLAKKGSSMKDKSPMGVSIEVEKSGEPEMEGNEMPDMMKQMAMSAMADDEDEEKKLPL